MNTPLVVSDKDFSKSQCHALILVLACSGKVKDVIVKVSTLAAMYPDATVKDLLGESKLN